MHDSLSVEVIEGLKKVLHHVDCILLVIQTLRFDPFEKLTALQVFEYQMDVLVALVHFIELNDMLMIYASQDVNLQQYRALKGSNCFKHTEFLLLFLISVFSTDFNAKVFSSALRLQRWTFAKLPFPIICAMM